MKYNKFELLWFFWKKLCVGEGKWKFYSFDETVFIQFRVGEKKSKKKGNKFNNFPFIQWNKQKKNSFLNPKKN
jgi:hypothetical protein